MPSPHGIPTKQRDTFGSVLTYPGLDMTGTPLPSFFLLPVFDTRRTTIALHDRSRRLSFFLLGSWVEHSAVTCHRVKLTTPRGLY